MTNGRLLILIIFALALLAGGAAAGHYLSSGGAASAEGFGVFAGMVITYILNALRGGKAAAPSSPVVSKPDVPPPAARQMMAAEAQVNPVRLALWSANQDNATHIARSRERSIYLRMLLVAIVALLAARMMVGCSPATEAAKKATAVVLKWGSCSAQRVLKQCAPAVKNCIAAQFKQCAGFEPKAPWVQPTCKPPPPTSQPSK